MTTFDSSPPRLEMRGVSKSFGATVALAGVDLRVEAGEVHALIGENGAGKSTLMKILSGAIRPDRGEMRLSGAPFRPRNPADGRRAGVAMIYQELSLAPHLNVMENIVLGAEPARAGLLRRDEMRRRAAEALRRIGHARLPLDAPVRRLSAAEQQLVEIARSVAQGSQVLVLDEPTSSLTWSDVRLLLELIVRLRDSGHAIVYISHILEEVREIADRCTVLRDGRVAGGGALAELSDRQIVDCMVGRRVDELYPRSPRTAGEPLLELDRMCGARMPQDASLALRRGEVVGLAGLIGAGRTELLRCVFGLDRVRAGELRVAAVAGPRSPAQRWMSGVGFLSESRAIEGLALNRSIAENVTIARAPTFGPLGLISTARESRAARPWIERLAIRCADPHQPVRALSGGNQQKVALARLLHADVDLLLLDEPTRGIDVGSKAEIYRLIDALAAGEAAGGRRPRGVLLVSSFLPELLGVCDRIAVMRRGRLAAARPGGEWTAATLMEAAVGVAEGVA